MQNSRLARLTVRIRGSWKNTSYTNDNFEKAYSVGISRGYKVVMVRHGESLWNKENRFSGWCDIPLTARGELDAADAGLVIKEKGLMFDVAFTSQLERAWRTCAITLAKSDAAGVETIRTSSLNERHYGALQGHLKSSKRLIDLYGSETVKEWKQSYDVAPPSLYDIDFLKNMEMEGLITSSHTMHPSYIDWKRFDSVQRAISQLGHIRSSGPNSRSNQEALKRAKQQALREMETHSINFRVPSTESLKNCEERAYRYWLREIAPRVQQGERVLIVAHANTIRALVKAIDKIDDRMIAHLKIPNGIPLVYEFDENMKATDLSDDIGFQAKYLVSTRNYEKILKYERDEKKKLRSIFEFLDKDGTGMVTPELMLDRLSQLKNASSPESEDPVQEVVVELSSTVFNPHGFLGSDVAVENRLIPAGFCEYEVQELFKCIPQTHRGIITLQDFLAASEVLMPRLHKLMA